VKGYNSRLDELQAAFLRAKLPRLDQDNARRSSIASLYTTALSEIRSIRLPTLEQDCESVWHLYVVRAPDRDLLAQRLAASGIGTLVHYPIPPHLQPAYRDLGFSQGTFPIAEAMHREVLSLPMDPTITSENASAVVSAVKAALSDG
jgi:dTDP-4-amino-4,6-dideoxygalactose transaminase